MLLFFLITTPETGAPKEVGEDGPISRHYDAPWQGAGRLSKMQYKKPRKQSPLHSGKGALGCTQPGWP